MDKHFIFSQSKYTTGFITHEDQEKNGLKFSVVDNIIKVTGEEAKILEWSNRNMVSQTTETAYISKISEIENNKPENLLLNLSERVTKLEEFIK